MMSRPVIKRGSKGDDVVILQHLLNVEGYKLTIDGDFGQRTETAVKMFQQAHNLEQDGIVGAKTWAALGIKSESKEQPLNLKKSTRTITEIIVHCTATKEGVATTTEQIKHYHMTHGWTDIAYNYVIELDGSIHNGRDVNKVGGHTTNHNAHSIGVVYVGGLDKQGKAKDTRTEAQKASLLKLLKQLKAMYPKAVIYGHRNFARKDCPCFDAKTEYKAI
jgi:N-acetylmuramoyl-L-alanine amidase